MVGLFLGGQAAIRYLTATQPVYSIGSAIGILNEGNGVYVEEVEATGNGSLSVRAYVQNTGNAEAEYVVYVTSPTVLSVASGTTCVSSPRYPLGKMAATDNLYGEQGLNIGRLRPNESVCIDFTLNIDRDKLTAVRESASVSVGTRAVRNGEFVSETEMVACTINIAP